MVDSIQSFSFSFGKLSFVRKIPEIGCGPCAAAAGRNSRTGGGIRCCIIIIIIIIILYTKEHLQNI